MSDEMLELARSALNAEYANMLPPGGKIVRLAIYDPLKHKAPHLHFERKKIDGPTCYIATIEYGDEHQFGFGSHLGATLNDAVKTCIAEIHGRMPKQ